MTERVRVAVRIRPFLPTDPDDADLSTIVLDSTHVAVGEHRVFTVDEVFKMEDDNEYIFHSLVRPLLAEFTRGYNATILSYGQTGTGKTFTTAGIGPLVINEIVQGALGGSTRQLSVQCVEVYGDTLRDLLAEDPVASTKTLQLRDGTGEAAGHTDAGGKTSNSGAYVMGAIRFRPRSLAEMLEIFAHTSRMRSTGATGMNETSSRSHSIFTVLYQHEGGTAKLNLVDLAGSERNKRTHNQGQRFKESIGINTGLLALGNVIRALGRNHQVGGAGVGTVEVGAVQRSTSAIPIRPPILSGLASHQQGGGGAASGAVSSGVRHVPYRSSKLTRLLQDALGGNCKTIMIACVAPDSYNMDETTRTLQYCSLALKILNEPVRNYDLFYKSQGGRGRRRRRRSSMANDYGDRSRTSSSFSDDDAHEHVDSEGERSSGEEVVPAATYRDLERLYSERGDLVTSLGMDIDALVARVGTCEEELRKDEVIFARQIVELKRLAEENRFLHTRVGQLEGQQRSTTEMVGVPSLPLPSSFPSAGGIQDADTEDAFTRNILQLHGAGDAGLSQPSSFDVRHTRPSFPAAARQVSLSAQDGEEADVRSMTDFTAQVLSGEAAGGDRDNQLVALAREALHYQNHNTELRNKLSSVVALLESQRRETALLRLELDEIHHLLDA